MDGRPLTMDEAAEYLGISYRTSWGWIQVYPDFPVAKLSKRNWRVPKDRLDAWLVSRIGKEPASQTTTVRVTGGRRWTVDDL